MKPEIPYQPIACSVYDLLEAAALHQKALLLRIEGVTRKYIIRDVFSKGKEEFLIGFLADTSEESTIRLDKIDLIIDPTDKKSYFPTQC
jgi:transcriptional antiterminator Rof (Rho-off)